jgi:hypothetical protein
LLKKTAMQKSVLVEIISVLDKKELRRLHKWLLSPAHNQREDVVQLFEYLTKHITDENDKSLEKERAWKHLFPKEPFDDARMRQSMYFLLQNVEEFLVFTELQKDEAKTQSILLKVYRSRKIDRAFRLTMEALKKRQINEKYRNSAFFKTQYELEEEQYQYFLAQKWSMEFNVQDIADTLDLSYISDKLRVSCMMLSHQSIYKKAIYSYGTLDFVFSYLEKHPDILKEPAVSIYYYGYKASTEMDKPEYFERLLNVIFDSGNVLPNSELHDSYLLALNYCTGRINRGQREYIKQAFDIYKNGCETNILLVNNIITKNTFYNTVLYAITLKEFEWVEHFIYTFEKNLDEKHRKSMVNFSLARLFFEQNQYDKAQQYLFDFEYDDPVMNMIAKTILLKIYFDRRNLNAFESLIESMRSYLQRQEYLSQAHKQSFKNLLSQMKKLGNLNPYSKTEIDKFEAGVREANPLSDREWFLAQVEKMRKR